MYKVFYKDIPIILSTNEDFGKKYLSLPIKEANIKQIIKKIKNGKLFYVNLYHSKEKKLLKHLKKQLKPVVAGGGLVKNKAEESLFIYRKNRWDIPKGKAEKGEDIKETAMREVEEETGVQNLEIIKPLPTTYHIFKRKGKYRLKITYWFEMKTEYEGPLTPETNEDITQAVWKNKKEAQKALQNSYGNIKLLFPEEYLTE